MSKILQFRVIWKTFLKTAPTKKSLFAKLKTNTDEKNYEKLNEKEVENNVRSGHWKKVYQKNISWKRCDLSKDIQHKLNWKFHSGKICWAYFRGNKLSCFQYQVINFIYTSRKNISVTVRFIDPSELSHFFRREGGSTIHIPSKYQIYSLINIVFGCHRCTLLTQFWKTFPFYTP